MPSMLVRCLHCDDRRSNIVTDERKTGIHASGDFRVERFVVECGRMCGVEPCCGERLGNVEVPVLVVVDPSPELPVGLERCVVAIGRTQRLHDSKHVVRLGDRRVVVAIGSRIVLLQKTDGLPRDIEVTLWLHYVDDPTGRHPAPRSNGVYPEINMHRVTVACPHVRNRMKAIQIGETGGPDVMTWTEVDAPIAGPGQVVVDVLASGVNFIDTYHRTGLYPVPMPSLLGLEGAGTVSALGEGVDTVAVGDLVAWSMGFGSYAEQVAINAESVVPVPDGVSAEVAAATMLQGMTAHYLVTDTHPLAAGEKCLIHAGAGGVGLILIQMAKSIGAEVFTTVGTEEKEALALAAGADHVIRYRDVDFGDAIEAIAGPRPLAVVYDGVGQSVFRRSLDLLAPRGMMATFGNASGAVEPISPLELAPSLFLTRPSLGE